MADSTLDNLGRKIDTANMSIGALKGLIGTLMNNKVGQAKPVRNTKKEESTANPGSGSKELTKLFENYIKNFKEEVSAQRSLLQQVVDTLKQMSGMKESRKQENKEKEPVKKKDKTSFSDKVSKLGTGSKDKPSKYEKITATATKSLENIFGKKGSGYTHDIHCEAVLKSILQAVQDCCVKSTTPTVRREKSGSSGSAGAGTGSPATSEILDTVNKKKKKKKKKDQLVADDYYEVELSSIFRVLKGTKELRELKMRAGLSEIEIQNEIQKLYRARDLSGNKIVESLEEAESIIRNQVAYSANTLKNIKHQEELWSTIKTDVKDIETLFLGFNSLDKIFKGVISAERDFTKEIRQAAYETAGVTAESGKLQKSFENIGTTTRLTGMNRSDFQKEYLKTLRSGVKDQKKVQALVTSQLNTEKQVGLAAGDLGETFVKLSNELQFNNDQIAQVGRGIKEASRSTGLIGDKLKTVVAESQKYMDMMRKAGTATAGSAKNIIGLQAEFTKLGVDASSLLTALSSSTGFMDANAQTKALIANLDLAGDALRGVALKGPAGIKKLSNNMVTLANKMGLAGASSEEMRKNLEELSDDAKMRLNLRLKTAFGVESGELTSMLEGFENQSKSTAEKLADLNKMKAQNLTLEEKATIAEKERNIKLNASLSVLGALSESAKNADSMSEALSKFGKKRGDFEGDMQALGQSWTNETDVARAAIKGSLDNINAGLKKSGKSEISINSSEIEKALKDPTALRELTAKITEGEQALSTAQKSQLDPLTSMDQKLTELNDSVRSLSQGLISGIFNSMLGKILIAVIALGGIIVGALASLEGGILRVVSSIGKFFKLKSADGSGTSGDLFGGAKKAIDKLLGRKPETEAVETAVVKEEKNKRPLEGKCCDKLLGVNQSMLDVLKSIQECVCKVASSTVENLEQKALPKSTEDIREKGLTPVSSTKGLTESAEQAAAQPPAEKAAEGIKQQDKAGLTPVSSTKGLAKSAEQAAAQPPAEKAAEGIKQQNKKARMSPEEIAAKKASGQAMKERATASGISPSVAKSIKRQEVKNVKMDTTINKGQRKNLISDIQNGKKTSTIIRREQQASKGPAIPEAPDVGGLDLGKILSSGKEMAKSAAAIAILGLGAIALGAAIVFLSKKILGSFNLDMSTILQTAGAIAALAVAGGAIAVAGILAIKALESDGANDFSKKMPKFNKELLMQVAAIALIGPVLVLLGAAVVKMCSLIIGSLGLDLSTVAETAGVVAAIVGAAGALAWAANEAISALSDFPEIDKAMLTKIGKAAIALVIIAPSLVLLSAAVVKTCEWILNGFNINPASIVKTVSSVAALIAGAGAIALAVLAASFGLQALGVFANGASAMIPYMLAGAAALLLVAPAIVALAAGLNFIISSILSIAGINAKQAAKTAFDVAMLIASTGVIALAVMAAGTALTILGAFASVAWAAAPFMLLGAAALLAIATPIVALAAGLNFIINSILSVAGINAKQAARTAFDVAALFASTSVIALAVIGAGAALTILGILSPIAWAAAPLMALGAAALLVMVPAVLALTSAIVGMASAFGGINVDVKNTIEKLDSVLNASSSIALSILASVASLSILGLLAGAAIVAVPLMALGALALLMLTPVVIGLANSIIGMAKEMNGLGLEPSASEQVAKNLGSIIESASNIAFSIIKAVAGMSILGILYPIAIFAVPLMWLGKRAFDIIVPPVLALVESIVNASKSIGGIISPSKASEMANGVANVLGAVGYVTDRIVEVKDKLAGLRKQSFFAWFFGLSDPMYSGVKALNSMLNPTIEYVKAIKTFSQRVGAVVEPRLAAEMANGVANVLGAVGYVTDRIVEVQNKLAGLKKQSFFNWLTGLLNPMYSGVSALNSMLNPTIAYITAIKTFSKRVGAVVAPRLAAEMANGVANVLGAVGFVTDRIIQVKDKLAGLKKQSFFAWFFGLSDPMYSGIKALNSMLDPTIEYVKAIKTFSQRVGAIVEPRLVASMANGVASILGAVGYVTDRIMSAKDKLISIKSSEGFWIFSTDIIKAMTNGVKALNEMQPSLLGYVKTVISFARNLGKEISPGEGKKLSGTVAMISNLMSLTSFALNNMAKGLVPLTQGGFFTKSPIDQITEAKVKIEQFFPVIIDFVKAIADKVNSALGDVGKIKSAGKSLRYMSNLLQELAPSLNVLGGVMVPFTQDGFFTDSPMKKIKAAIPSFSGFIHSIADFVNNGIVKPIAEKASNLGEINSAAKKMNAIAKMLQSAAISITSLSSVVGLMDSSFFYDSPMEKIMKNKTQFAGWFSSIADFVNSGIIQPISKVGNAQGLEQAKKVMMALGGMLCGTGMAIYGLSQVMGLMDDSFFSTSPMGKIMKNKEKFAEWFSSIASFVNSGIVDPVLKTFPKIDSLLLAAKAVDAMSSISAKINPMMTNLGKAISLAVDDSFFEEAPMVKILASKDIFASYLKSITIFMRDGIVTPVIKEMEGVDVSEASKIISSMSSIASNINPMMVNLGKAVALAVDDSWVGEAPMEKILASKDIFAGYLKSITIFMRDGIVNPVIKEMEGVKVSEAAKIISSMTSIAGNITPLITNLAKAMGLMSGAALKDLDSEFPIDKIIQYKDIFAGYFENIAVFIRDGIVAPVISEFPDPQILSGAGKTLSSMNSVISNIPSIFKNLSSAFGDLNGDIFSDSPAQELAAKTNIFSDWFWSITGFFRYGIILPIMTMPDASEFAEAEQKLASTSYIVSSISPWLDEIALSVSSFSKGFFWRMIAGYKVGKMAKSFAYMSKIVNEDIIKPIQENFSSSGELEEVIKQLDSMVIIVDKVGLTMDLLGESFNSIKPLDMNLGGLLSTTGKLTDINDSIKNQGNLKKVAPLENKVGSDESLRRMKPDAETGPVGSRASKNQINLKKTFDLDAEEIADEIEEMNLLASRVPMKTNVQNVNGSSIAVSRGSANMSGGQLEEKLSGEFSGGIRRKDVQGNAVKLSPEDKNSADKVDEALRRMKPGAETGPVGSSGGALSAGALGSRASNDKKINSRSEERQSEFSRKSSLSLKKFLKISTSSGTNIQEIKEPIRLPSTFLKSSENNSLTKTKESTIPKKSGFLAKTTKLEAPPKTIFQTLTNIVTAPFKLVGSAVGAIGSTIWSGVEGVGSALSGAGSAVGSAISNAGSALWSGVEGVDSAISSAGSALWSGVKGVGSAIWSGVEKVGSAISGANSAGAFTGGEGIKSAAIDGAALCRCFVESNREAWVQSGQSGQGGQSSIENNEGLRKSLNFDGASVETLSNMGGAKDIEQTIMKDRASAAPSKSEIMSPELGEIVAENEEQTEILYEMKELFEKFIELLKPKAPISSSTGGEPGSTALNRVTQKPANYFRRVVGNTGQTPGKAIIGLGAKAVS